MVNNNINLSEFKYLILACIVNILYYNKYQRTKSEYYNYYDNELIVPDIMNKKKKILKRRDYQCRSRFFTLEYYILILPFIISIWYSMLKYNNINLVNKYLIYYSINQLVCTLIGSVTIFPPVNKQSRNIDLIYSGHTFSIMIGFHMLTKLFIPNKKYLPLLVANIAGLIQSYYLITNKMHYSVDCFLSIYIMNIYFFFDN